MILLKGISNTLGILYENWSTILVCIGFIVGIVIKTKKYFQTAKEKRVAIVKAQISQIMLQLITEAELTYEEWTKAGSIKRSQVIQTIYEKYPILSKVANQDEIIAWLDETINDSLKTMREIFKENSEQPKE